MRQFLSRCVCYDSKLESESLLGFLVAQRLKHLPAVREIWVWFLGRKDLLEKEMAIHSSILVWRIPWTEEPGGLQSTGSQRVGRDWVTSLSLSLYGEQWWLFLYTTGQMTVICAKHFTKCTQGGCNCKHINPIPSYFYSIYFIQKSISEFKCLRVLLDFIIARILTNFYVRKEKD